MHAPTTTDRTTEPLSIRAAASRLGYSYRHVRRLIAQGRLDARVVARNRSGRPIWRIALEELERFDAERSAS